MKIRSLEELQDRLDEDFSWRIKELIQLKSLIHATNNPSFIRAGLALLCAHFEGFIKLSSNYYIIFICDQKIPNYKLKRNFIALEIKHQLQDCAQSDKTSYHQKFVEYAYSCWQKNFYVKYASNSPVISTESNPSSTVVKEIMKSIGLDFTPFETKKNYIDTDLLSNRHKIVHGERFSMDLKEFDSTYENVVKILKEYKEIILNSAIQRKYLDSSAG